MSSTEPFVKRQTIEGGEGGEVPPHLPVKLKTTEIYQLCTQMDAMMGSWKVLHVVASTTMDF
jgi:hypothetical protein